jgi:hypothetical protein
VAPETLISFGPRARAREEERGAVTVELEATNPSALVRHVLSLDRAEILMPRALRAEAGGVLARLARRLG